MAAPIAMAMQIAGAAVSAFGAYEGGQAGQSMANYRARVAQINAGLATEQAGAEEAAGGQRAQISGMRTGFQMGLTRTGIAAGGLNPGTGSGARVLSSEAQVGQFEQAAIGAQAERGAFRSRVAAFSDTAQADLDVAAGQQEATSGKITAISTLLGGATATSDKWAKYTETSGTPPLPFEDPSAIG